VVENAGSCYRTIQRDNADVDLQNVPDVCWRAAYEQDFRMWHLRSKILPGLRTGDPIRVLLSWRRTTQKRATSRRNQWFTLGQFLGKITLGTRFQQMESSWQRSAVNGRNRTFANWSRRLVKKRQQQKLRSRSKGRSGQREKRHPSLACHWMRAGRHQSCNISLNLPV